MKKVLVILALGAFAACNNGSESSTPAADTTKPAVDTAAKPATDTAAKPATDTTAKKDSAGAAIKK
ncbi:MAG: hypothetical protein C5B52_19485 [Bacteroidetes bacterium]|nr:MAG: hypothetical protein C5B52_19485 [Bacteroidota bacterium]